MSQRKLQQDIDKLLKKVREGLEDFEVIYEKFQDTEPSNNSYREKLEADLKREIKKLQKHREQIKTWLSKDDTKDRQQALMENRRLIENGMERFKSIEKLMKTKQFSKEALTNPDIIKDPRELKKRDQVEFIHECLDELQKQLESHEAQNDDEQIERHEFHITNLENILKMLQNNEMDPETIKDYQDDIKYYVENNEDPDFVEYDTIYEDMGCELNATTTTPVPVSVPQAAATKKSPKKELNSAKKELKKLTISSSSPSPSPSPSRQSSIRIPSQTTKLNNLPKSTSDNTKQPATINNNNNNNNTCLLYTSRCV